MEGKGAIPPDLARLRLAVLTAEPSGTPHATPAGAAAPGSDGLREEEAPKTPPPPSPAPARAFPAVVSGGGEGVGEVAGENPRLPRVALGATRGTGREDLKIGGEFHFPGLCTN